DRRRDHGDGAVRPRRGGHPPQAAGAHPRRVRGRRGGRDTLAAGCARPGGELAMTCRAVLSIGGNQGDARALLRGVVEAAAADGILRGVSSLYATPPWGGVEQDDFLNAVLVVEHPGSPGDVLEWGFERERAAGRTRDVRWGPRTLDVDVVVAEVNGHAVTSADPRLTL